MKTEKEFRKVSEEIDKLFQSGKEDEVFLLIDKAIIESKHNKAYQLFFEGEQAHYLQDFDLAFEKASQALTLQPTDPFLLKACGVALSILGQFEESINYFNQSLKIKPDDYHTLRSKGVLLSKIDRLEEAIDFFNQALKINPDDNLSLLIKGNVLSNLGKPKEAVKLVDQALKIMPESYHALSNKGNILTKLGKPKDAIKQYDQALKIKPSDKKILRSKSIALFNIGLISSAYEVTINALELNPTSEQLQKDAAFIFSQLSEEDQKKFTKQPNQPDSTNIGGLTGFIKIVQKEFKDEIEIFKEKKAANEQHLLEFISSNSLLNPDYSVFLVLRKWNSYTPALPLDDGEKSVGGGYFIYHNGQGTVIDPGYNFIENFKKAGCRLIDIDNIVITHAHNDHTIDFESLLTLLYQVHKDKQLPSKMVNLYLNQGAMLKFSGLINWQSKSYIDKVFTINAGNTYTLNDGSTTMTTLPAYHDELVTRYYSVGLHFSLSFAENEKRNLLFTSDTGLYPPPEKDSPTQEQSSKTEIHELYRNINEKLVNDIDLLVPHLGSIGEDELNAVENMDWQPQDILYENHLGVLGVLRLISAIKPKLALVSEFGEELKGFREDLMNLMQKVIHKVIPNDPVTVLPADLPFIYNIKDRTAFCPESFDMMNIADIKFKEENETFYYYCDNKIIEMGGSLKNSYTNIGNKPYFSETGCNSGCKN